MFKMRDGNVIAQNRKERRALMAQTRKTMKAGHWGQWEHRFDEKNPPPGKYKLPGFVDGWCNNLFSVQRYKTQGWDRIMVRRHDSTRVVWAELQRIKNELFGEDKIGVEILPRQRDLVDSANMYWFFIVDECDEAAIDFATENKKLKV